MSRIFRVGPAGALVLAIVGFVAEPAPGQNADPPETPAVGEAGTVDGGNVDGGKVDDAKVIVYRPTRELPREDHLRARELRERGDRLNVEFQAGLRGARPMPNIAAIRGRRAAIQAAYARPIKEDIRESTIPPEQEAKAQELTDIYQEMIDKYALTEFGYYGVMHMSAMLRRRGKMYESVKMLEDAAIDYAGTKEGYQLILSISTFYTQNRNDHARAIQWLELMPKPAAPQPPGEGAGRAEQVEYQRAVLEMEGKQMDYLNAQERIIRSELELWRDSAAQARRERLKQFFPDYARSIDEDFERALQQRGQRPPLIGASTQRSDDRT
jgi:hypothetical protein